MDLVTTSQMTAGLSAVSATPRGQSYPGICSVILFLVGVSVFVGKISNFSASSYSSGAMHVWDLSTEDGPSRIRQLPGPYVISEPSCCDLSFPWGVVGTNDG